MKSFDEMIRIYATNINNYNYTFFDIIYLLIRDDKTVVIPSDIEEWVKTSDGWD